jgi:hypothetical protein
VKVGCPAQSRWAFIMSDFDDIHTFSNINPSEAELRNFAYDPKCKYVDQDWDICAVNFEHRGLYLEFTLDKNCPKQGLFLHMLYVLVGSLIYKVIESPMLYNEKSKIIYYGEPIVKKGEPIPRDVTSKIKTILHELKPIDNPEIIRLCKTIETKALHAEKGFDYKFWFEGGWSERGIDA